MSDIKVIDGEKMQIYNLRKFCKENGIDQGAMCHVHSGKNSHHKGWIKWTK